MKMNTNMNMKMNTNMNLNMNTNEDEHEDKDQHEQNMNEHIFLTSHIQIWVSKYSNCSNRLMFDDRCPLLGRPLWRPMIRNRLFQIAPSKRVYISTIIGTIFLRMRYPPTIVQFVYLLPTKAFFIYCFIEQFNITTMPIYFPFSCSTFLSFFSLFHIFTPFWPIIRILYFQMFVMYGTGKLSPNFVCRINISLFITY